MARFPLVRINRKEAQDFLSLDRMPEGGTIDEQQTDKGRSVKGAECMEKLEILEKRIDAINTELGLIWDAVDPDYTIRIGAGEEDDLTTFEILEKNGSLRGIIENVSLSYPMITEDAALEVARAMAEADPAVLRDLDSFCELLGLEVEPLSLKLTKVMKGFMAQYKTD